MMTIRDRVGMLPGGIIYDDPRTPAAKWTDDHTWLDERAQQVIAFRLANPTVYPEPDWTSLEFVKQQITDYNCQRLGFNPQWCLEVSKRGYQPYVSTTRVCPDCGAVLAEKVCPTCSGRRVTGYTCTFCKREFPK